MIRRDLCPITGKPSEVIFARSYDLPALRRMIPVSDFGAALSDKLYEVRYCPGSGLYFQTWVMEAHELPRWYSSVDDEAVFMSEISNQKLHWLAHQTEEILVFRQLCPTKNPTVLDFGCNWGKWASMALAYGCDVYAVEVNENAAAFCAKRGIKIVSAEQLEEMRFDFINCDQVIEHISDPLELVKLFSRCMNPGAFLKLSTPNNPGLARMLATAQRSGDDSVLNPNTLDSLSPLEHVNLFSRQSLNCLAETAGLLPYRLPLFKWLGAGQLWNIPRQLNRNIHTPFKRWIGKETYAWYQKSPE